MKKDNEIIKALECIASKENFNCDGCPYQGFYLLNCHRAGARDALRLIGHSRTEIESLKAELKFYKDNFCDDCRDSVFCTIRSVSCQAGYDIECNNGFEEELK